VTSDDKRLFATAAALSGRTLSDFMVSALREAAEAAIRERQTMRLAPADARTFVEALINPPEPTAALRRAAQRYRDTTGHDAPG